MNCEKCEELIGDLVDGSLSSRDQLTLNSHLDECLNCASVRSDLESIVGFCKANRGQYDAPPNEKALWLRIRNVVEAGSADDLVAQASPQRKSFLAGLIGRSWELSLPQLAAFVTAIVLFVSLATVVGLHRWEGTGVVNTAGPVEPPHTTVDGRVFQQQQVISYWNQRVELNKVRWNPNMRETFDRNMQVIDQAVSQSLDELNRNPHDEVSEQMLNDALNDKLALLKEFSDL